MQISLHKSTVNGRVKAPASKSYTIRGLMCAALANGSSRLWNPLLADDTVAAINVLRRIGVEIETGKERWEVRGNHFRVPAENEDLYCGESAATLRFMTAICSLVPGTCRLTGGPSLSARPVEPLVLALKGWGVKASARDGYPPVVVQGGTLKGGPAELPGNISSQFVSALLLAAPLAEKETTIRLTSSLESRSYVEMTLECLERFGIGVRHSCDWKEYQISPQRYRGADYIVEGDWSSASYLLALGAVGGGIEIQGLNPGSLQGDRVIVDFLREMGAFVRNTGEAILVRKQPLKAIRADLNECIDLLPTAAVLAALAEGTSELTGIARARLKESDRILSVKEGLERAGIRVTAEKDRLLITGGRTQRAVIDSHNDHRIAMAFSLLGAASGDINIEGAECVSKTFPEYWNTIRKLGVKTDEQ